MDLVRRSSEAGKLPENADQFNSIQEQLIERFTQLKDQYGFSLVAYVLLP